MVIHNLLKSGVGNSQGLWGALEKRRGSRWIAGIFPHRVERDGTRQTAFYKKGSVCAVLDVLDDLVDRRFEHGIGRQLALDHGDIGVDGAVVAGEGGADLRQG